MSNTLDCTIVSAECDCCLLTFSNAAGLPIRTLSLTSLQIHPRLDGKIQLQDGDGVGLTLTVADFVALGLTVESLLDKRKECNCVEDTTEPPEPIDPIKKPQGVPFSAHPIGEKKNLQDFIMWCDELGNVCYTPKGENANDTGVTIITLSEFNTDYTMTESTVGQLIIASPLIANEIPYEGDGLTLCLDATVQDVVALMQANPIYAAFVAAMTAKFPLPAGAAYGLSKVSIEQHSGTPKKNVHCDFVDAAVVVSQNTQVSVVGLGNTSFLTVGGRKNYGKALAPIEVVDADGTCKTCNDVACELVAADITVEGAVGNAVQIDFCISCFATPAENIEGEGGGKEG